MGLFTQEKTDYNVPVELRMAQDAAKSQRQFTDQYLDPFIKENVGYESPRMKMKSITQGVDLTDGKAVQKAYMELQAINPQEAQGWLQSIKPVIAQQLDSLKIKDAQLKHTKAKNKPLVTQRWNLEGRPNFIASHVATNFAGLEGVDDLLTSIQSEPKRADFYVNAFLNSMEKGDNKTALKKEYKELLKEAETNYMDTWLPKDTLDSTTPEVDTRNTGALKPPPPDGGDTTIKTPHFKADPTKSQIRQAMSRQEAGVTIQNTLRSINSDLTGYIPEFLMTDEELELENKRDDVQDWIMGGPSFEYFNVRNPKELAKFKANPVEYYEKVINKAK